MNNTRIVRLAALSAALVFAACGGGTKKCTSNADCASGQICNTGTGQCTAGGTGGGTGGGAMGGGTGGGAMGGGSGGGAMGGGTGGGAMGGGTGGGAMGGGTGGGTMQVDGGTIAGGETCDMAAAVTAGSVTFTGTTTGLASDYDLARFASGSGCNGYSSHPGADTVYQLSVPARSTVSVSVQGVGGDGTSMTMPIFDPSIYLVASPPSNCATATADGGVMATCIAASDDPFNSAADLLVPETLKWTNFDANASDVYLVIESGWDVAAMQTDTDGDGVDDTWVIGQGDYSVVVTTTALPPPPANDTCANAVTLSGSAMNGTTQGAAADLTFDANSTCIDTSGLGDVFYSAVVQPGMRLTVDATTQAANTAIGLNLFEGACSAVASCVTAVSQTTGTAASAFYDNRGTADITVMVAVVTNDQDNLGADFSITGTVASIPPPPGNDACAAPATLATATSTMGTIAGASSEMLFGASPTGCNDGQGGADMKDVYYTLLVHSGERATIVVTPSATLDPVVNVTDAPGTCTGVTACVASADSGSGGEPETLRYDNSSGADVTLLIQVGSWDGAEGTFDIQATVGAIPPPPANDTCAAPTMLMSGTQVTGTTVSANADSPYTSPTGCTATSTPKKDVYYTLQVGAGQTATVVVTPTGALATSLDPFINVYDSTLGCAGVAMCLANADSGFDGDPETLMYTNSGTAAVTLMIQVGMWAGAEGDFTVLATVQ